MSSRSVPRNCPLGVLHPKGQFLGTDLDDMVYIPASKGLSLFNRTSLMEIDIFYSPATTSAAISAKVKRLLIERHGYEDFTVVTQDEMLETMDNILEILKYAAAGLGAISLLVGAVGISTIMVISTTERAAEVGLLRALGATRKQIRNLFLGETILLGFIGGLFGILLVALLATAAWLLVPNLPVVLELSVVLAALLLSMLIGLIAGVRPAMQVTNLSPIDALSGRN